MERRKKIIIDVDTGTDDAQALIMALSQSDAIDVIAVTCVAGNTSVDNACVNTLRVLRACNRLDIPVYRGCTSSLLGERGREAASAYHGTDGLGDVNWAEPSPSINQIHNEHAAIVINRLVDSNPGEVTLVALGPLTNLALAVKLSPNLGKNLRELVIMGGSVLDRNPVEFNFATDPEAAHIVISQIGVAADRFFLLPIETCMDTCIDWDWVDTWMSTDTFIGRFHKDICRVNVAFRHSLGRPTYSTCDPCAMLIAITRIGSDVPSSASTITGSVLWKASVELREVESRGQLRRLGSSDEANITVVTSIDIAVYKQYLRKMVEQKELL